MASTFPKHPLKGTQSNAEREVFYALKDLLPDTYTVLHSVPVYRRDEKSGRLLDGEMDFLVLHPERGVLVIEVKGGGIERDPETGLWSSTGSNGRVNEIKDPYEQAKGACYAFLKETKAAPELRGFRYPTGYAVWFPDVDLEGKELGVSQHLRSITLGRNEVRHADRAVSRVFKNSIGDGYRGPGSEGVKALREFLAPSWKIPVKLSVHLDREEKRIVEATQKQYQLLSLLQRQRRALICGPAGSGKTLLAMEKARRIVAASPEARVLIVCFNVCLARRIAGSLSDAKGVEVFHFHGLCAELCKRAGHYLPAIDLRASSDHFFKHVLPEALLDALELLPDRYDAIIVDEGQDFDPGWWIPLQVLLREMSEGILYIFYDDNQMLYGRIQEFPLQEDPFVLSENCRNTRHIHEEAMKYYRGDVVPESLGPEGRPPAIVKIPAGESEKETLERVVKKLVKEENLSPSQVAILTPRGKEKSLWGKTQFLAGVPLRWLGEGTPGGREGGLLCSTIHSFKGLESPIVILTETGFLNQSTRNNLLYVALSRANSHLVVLADA